MSGGRASVAGERGALPDRLRHLQALAGDVSLLHAASQGVFLAAVLLCWIGLKPFPDLSRLDIADLVSGRDGLMYVSLGGLACAALALALRDHARALLTLASPLTIGLIGWLCLSVVLSQDRGTSAKRFALSAAVMLLAACLPLLVRSRRELCRLLAIAALVLLGLCFIGILVAPHLAIHQLQDFLEPELAGDWRGSFGHKNAAAAVIAIVFFIGIGIARSGMPVAGSAIVLLSAIFLVGANGKSAFAICLLVIGLTGAFAVVRSLVGRSLLTLGPLALFNLLSVGTVLNDGLARLVAALPIDATFTGRTDVWSFAIEAIKTRPIAGHGFFAFWQSQGVRDAAEDASTWAGGAAHSHNGFVDTALTTGLVGCALTVLVFAVLPLLNYQRADAARDDSGPLATMFLQIWLFGLLLATMESFFYDRGDPIWFTFLIAVFGLHYLARFRIR